MAPRWCVYVAHRWRFPKVFYVLIGLEVPLTIACLALFGIAQPNTYRTKLWQNGSNHGFNSNPNEILYAYANYEPIHVPLIWSEFMTEYNVAVSVLSMFVMLVKAIMYVLHTWLPILSIFTHAILIVIWAISVRNQATPDLSVKTPNLSKTLPWYLEKGCSYASSSNHGYCMQARASFAIACVMLALMCTYFGWSIFNAFITKAEKEERLTDYNEEIELKNARYTYNEEAGLTKEERWEKNRQIFLNLPKTPNTPGFGGARNPMTPRTTAFTQLSGGNASGASGPSRQLAFRQQYEQYGDGHVPVPDAR